MNIIAITINSQEFIINNIISLSIKKSTDAQAHSLSCSIFADKIIDNISEIKVIDNDFILFAGIVDTQKITCDGSGLHIDITARSYSALLIDSEALPTTYYMPSLQLIYDKNIAPYNIKGYKGDNKTYTGILTINKNSSEWSVLQNFANKFMGVTPIIDENKVLDLTDNNKNNTVIINFNRNTMSISKELRPYKLISKIIMRTNDNSDYSTIINNSNTNALLKKRYYDTVNNQNIYTSEQILKNTNNQYQIIKIIYSGFLDVQLYNKFEIFDSPINIGSYNLTVSEIKYTLSNKGKYTYLTLKATNRE